MKGAQLVAALVLAMIAGGAVVGVAGVVDDAQAAPALTACATEDSVGPCAWDAERDGNGRGRSFWVDADQVVHYAPAVGE